MDDMALSIRRVSGLVFGLFLDGFSTPSFHFDLRPDGAASIAVSPNHLKGAPRVRVDELLRATAMAGDDLSAWWNVYVLPLFLDRPGVSAERKRAARDESAVICALVGGPTTVHGVVSHTSYIDERTAQAVLDDLVESEHVVLCEEVSESGLPLYALQP